MNHSSHRDNATAQEIRAMLRTDLVAAMKARKTEVVAVLRTAIAAIDNAEAVTVPDGAGTPTSSGPIAGASAGASSTEVPRRDLSPGEVRAILEAQVAERLAAADQYDTHGQHEAADRLRQEAGTLGKYLA